MTQAFPYADYQAAVNAESKARSIGVEATVLSVECDETRERCFVMGVSPLGRMDESLYENGRVLFNGTDVGRIVTFVDAAAGIVIVESGKERIPAVGSVVMFMPADYLEPLREFADEMVEKPELRRESWFLGLRERLLASTPQKADIGDRPYLRWAQRLAVEESVNRDFSLLWGPSGTGKSYTLGHMAEYYRSVGKRVLVLSTTNAAADVATFAVDDACKRCGTPLADGEFIRYAHVLTQPEEYRRRSHLMSFTKLLRELDALQRKAEKRLADARRGIAELNFGDEGYMDYAACVEAALSELKSIGQKRRDEVSSLLAKAKIVCCTITSCLYNDFISGEYDVILLDEASQVPLAVWPLLMNHAHAKKFVVAGDPMQLEPVQARDTGVNSQFWFDQNIYAYLGMTTFRGIEPFYDVGAMTLLNEQSRMRKDICGVVSKMFYNGVLEGDRKDAPMEFECAGLPNGAAVVLDPSAGGEQFGFDRIPSARLLRNTNVASAGQVLKCIREIVRCNPKGRKLDIMVLSPFRAQAYKIYAPYLRQVDHGNEVTIRALTVHSSQGSEADIVFFDLVNPTNCFISREDAAHIWCVACSRAKQKLVIVGDVSAMRHGYYSSRFLECLGNGVSYAGSGAAVF